MVLAFRNIKIILLVIVITINFSCEKEFHSNSVDCAFCYTEEPEYDALVIQLTIDEDNQTVPVKIYEGIMESGIEVYSDTVDTTKIWVDVELNKKYTVKAEYFSNGKHIIAVDNDKIKSKYNTEDCSESCWAIIGGYIDVRLKY
ncbi:hypothetical protein ACFLTE_08480 [Bacteroidota bacterium]